MCVSNFITQSLLSIILLNYIFQTDCGLIYVDKVTSDGFDVVWTCPCSDWSSVDKYTLNVVASDGEIDYSHVSRTDGMYVTPT